MKSESRETAEVDKVFVGGTAAGRANRAWRFDGSDLNHFSFIVDIDFESHLLHGAGPEGPKGSDGGQGHDGGGEQGGQGGVGGRVGDVGAVGG